MRARYEEVLWFIVVAIIFLTMFFSVRNVGSHRKYDGVSTSQLEHLVAKKVSLAEGIDSKYKDKAVSLILSIDGVSQEALYQFLDSNIEIEIVSECSSESKLLGDEYAGVYIQTGNIQEESIKKTSYTITVDYRYIDYALLHEIGHYVYESGHLSEDKDLHKLISRVAEQVVREEFNNDDYFNSYSEFYAQAFSCYLQGTLKNEELKEYFSRRW